MRVLKATSTQNITAEISHNGKYSGKYKSGLYATDVGEGKRLVYNRIKELKDLMVRKKLFEMNKDFENDF